MLKHRSETIKGKSCAVSGLEQSQNSQRLSWSREEVEARLKNIMKQIHRKCQNYGEEANGKPDCVKGADAMLAYGIM